MAFGAAITNVEAVARGELEVKLYENTEGFEVLVGVSLNCTGHMMSVTLVR